MFRYMAAAVVDNDAKGFDSTYKEALSYMNFISKDKVHRHGGEVSRTFAKKYYWGYKLIQEYSDVPLSVSNDSTLAPG